MTRRKAKAKKDPWYVSRDGGASSPDGEWECGNSYSCKRPLAPALVPKPPYYGGWVSDFPRPTLHVRIHGKFRGFHLQVTNWKAWLEFGNFKSRPEGWNGKCKTLKGAMNAAYRQRDLKKKVAELVKKAYSPGRHDCIYKMIDGKWIPWATEYNVEYYCSLLEHGDYKCVHPVDYQGNTPVFEVTKIPGGYTGGFSHHLEVPEQRWGDAVPSKTEQTLVACT